MVNAPEEENMTAMACPFCGHGAIDEYSILYHLEVTHPEGESGSPFMVKNHSNSDQRSPLQVFQDEEYVQCPINSCGEAIHLYDLDSHVDMHSGEEGEAEPTFYDSESRQPTWVKQGESSQPFGIKIPRAPQILDGNVSHASKPPDRQVRSKAGWRELLKMPNPSPHVLLGGQPPRKRLGTSELGPYATEKIMPLKLRKLLETDGEVRTIIKSDGTGGIMQVPPENYGVGILVVLEQLLQQDSSTEYAFTCHPCCTHISKLRDEGGFCGYRNIQMLSSYILGAQSQGYYHFSGKIPSIFQIQEIIEHAWDLGINKQGRQETGGIRGTRKYIGTPEAQAMFCSLNIAQVVFPGVTPSADFSSCDAQGLKSKANISADELLFQEVEQYFRSSCTSPTDKVRKTLLPPIYFQHPGHSMTIVGIEKMKDGSKNLIVFDPMFHDSKDITKLVGHKFSHKHPQDILRAYRRGSTYLKKYSEFEMLRLTPPKVD